MTLAKFICVICPLIVVTYYDLLLKFTFLIFCCQHKFIHFNIYYKHVCIYYILGRDLWTWQSKNPYGFNGDANSEITNNNNTTKSVSQSEQSNTTKLSNGIQATNT